jgi:hypothetical protein
MSTPTFDSLRQTLQHLRRRRSNLYLLKVTSLFAIALVSLLLASSLLGLWLGLGKTGSIGLFLITSLCGIGLLAGFVVTLSRRHTDDRMLAHYVEDRIPDFEQRLLTSLEFTEEDLRNGRAGVSQQFIQQLWQDAQVHVQQQQHEVETVTPARDSWVSFASAVAVVAIVAVTFISSDSLLQSGARLVWPFAISEPSTVAEFFPDIEISVEPGDIDMQRGDSVTIIARVTNATPDAINLRLQDDNVNWRDVSMSRDGSGSDSASYSYFIPALDEDTTYYIAFNERGEQSSQQYKISMFDLPQIEQIDLAFDYPRIHSDRRHHRGDSGDMVVPEGTVVDLTIQFNKAIETALLEFEESYSEEDDETLQCATGPMKICS